MGSCSRPGPCPVCDRQDAPMLSIGTILQTIEGHESLALDDAQDRRHLQVALVYARDKRACPWCADPESWAGFPDPADEAMSA